MALTPCQECGAEISTDADACPKCGRPTVSKRREEMILGIVGLAVVVYVILKYFRLL